MKETDIRPAALFDEYLRLSAEDVKTYFADADTRVERDCAGCGGGDHAEAFEKNGFRFARCKDCDTLFCNPCPDPAHLARFYRESPSQAYWAKTFFPAVAEVRRETLFRPKAAEIKALYNRHGDGGGRVIDVGAGAGAMLEEIRHAGFGDDLCAVEPTADLAQRCREKGFEAFEGFAEDAAASELAGSAALVTSFEVIEHVVSPFDFLSHLGTLARPGGLVLVTGLCGSGFDIQVLGRHSKSVSPPHHLNFITRRGVARLLARCGLDEIAFTTPGVLDVDIVANSFAEDPTRVTDPFLRGIFSENSAKTMESFQNFITSSNLSSHMWILAGKPGRTDDTKS